MAHDIRFAVLGRMTAHRETVTISTGSPQQQAVLAVLLLRGGRAVPAEELIYALWGEEVPDSAVRVLRTYAWRWRRALEQAGAEGRMLQSVGDGYQLDLPPENLDAWQAERLSEAAARAQEDGDTAEAARLLDAAIGLWRGEPLAGIPGPYAQRQRDRLGELRLALRERQFDCELQLGRFTLMVPALAEFTTEHPTRERPYAMLMRALYASGRQADALTVFDGVRRLLGEALGVAPGPELQALHRQVLANDPELAVEPGPASTGASVTGPGPALDRSSADAPTADGPEQPVAALPVPAQLPSDIADFTGRERVLAQLCEALAGPTAEGVRTAVLIGMGGVGKTTAALRVAHRVRGSFPDGQLHADLGGDETRAAAPGEVLASFLAALGVTGPALPKTVADRARLYRSLLDGRRVLVVLDNAQDSAQVRPLLPGSDSCAVILTSRRRLFGLPAETQLDLEVFETEEALALLAKVAGAQRVAADPQAARELVAACGHLPLAVRIVAARLASRPAWTVARLAGKLADERRRMAELVVGDFAVATAFEWGYRHLTDDQARAFRLIAGTARPDIGLPAAAAVLGVSEDSAEQLLEGLVDAGMLIARSADRYGCHDLLRAFALEQSARREQGAERITAIGRLLDFLLATVSSAFQVMVPGDPVATTLSVSPARGLWFTDVGAARAWVSAEAEGAVAAVLAATVELPADGSAMLRTAADLLIALTPFGRDVQYEQLAIAASAVAEVAVFTGDRLSEGRAQFILGNVALQATRLSEAERYSRGAAQSCRATRDTVILRQALNDLGMIAQYQHRFVEAGDYYDESAALARDLGHRSGELTTVLNAALARARSGRSEEAALACEATLSVLQAVGDRHGAAYALYVLGLAQHEAGRFESAVTAFTECLDLCGEVDIPVRAAQARYRLADSLRALGRSTDAVHQAERALADCARIGAERDRGYALRVLAQALAESGDREAAGLRLHEAHAVFTRLGLPDREETARLLAAGWPAPHTV
ncbi:BTAD domain-containing putative transcriptional regulator [Kitasatospora sp. GP82]|uniref:AfsR/SARP family transcriptional regulator n=1 Tax=Kitasatospora sp. GP82 TaxID=3035089 RepID=UPI0024749360|nr:BTAD domain-containing putative transcriptional regulator [Kitasatospora sp. GP82]MDH6125880.1 DNA-binding SARP family transcriptional activator [Kitasatospora sp. GP82]